MAQKFIYLASGQEVTLDDPTDSYTPDQIKQHWTTTFPELSNASWEEKRAEDGTRVITFAKKVGTKGANALRRYIQPDEVVVLRTGEKFTCKFGPGMSPKSRLTTISGLAEDGTACSIKGFLIDIEATGKLKNGQVDAKLLAIFKEKAARS
jgi:PRTRC genetic system protein C